MRRDWKEEDLPAAKRMRASAEMPASSEIPKPSVGGVGTNADDDGVVIAMADMNDAERTPASGGARTDDDNGKHPKQFEPTFGALPNPETCGDMDPDSFIKLLVNAYLGFAPKTLQTLTLPEAYFPGLNGEHLAAYGLGVVAAVRENDFEQIKALHHSGHALACCNRFGESLLHMACRRGYTQVFHFLLNEANVGVRIKDDCGRTPLHDACWNREPQYEIMDALLRRDPALLLMADKRGHTPFAYARREHWGVWRQFLSDRAQFIVRGLDKTEERKIFGGPEQ